MKIFSLFLIDVDECAEGKHACPGECKNTDGSYECLCPKGYIINEAKTACVGKYACLVIRECMARG